MDRDIVRECPWSHAVEGRCVNNVTAYQMADLRKRIGRVHGCGSRCPNCNQWIAPPGVAATHDRFGQPIEAALAPLTAAELDAQADRCQCGGADAECPCRHDADAQTVAERIAAAAVPPGYAAIPLVQARRR